MVLIHQDTEISFLCEILLLALAAILLFACVYCCTNKWLSNLNILCQQRGSLGSGVGRAHSQQQDTSLQLYIVRASAAISWFWGHFLSVDICSKNVTCFLKVYEILKLFYKFIRAHLEKIHILLCTERHFHISCYVPKYKFFIWLLLWCLHYINMFILEHFSVKSSFLLSLSW